MKPTTILVSALATLVAAAPASEKKVEERSFAFDVGQFNNFNGFQSVNLNYLAKLNGLNLNILSLLADNNNLNIGGFQNLFNIGNDIKIQDILLLQQLQDLQQFHNAGILNNFNLANFQFGGFNGLGFGGSILDTGLLNLGGVGLNSFINPSVVTQVQTVAQSCE